MRLAEVLRRSLVTPQTRAAVLVGPYTPLYDHPQDTECVLFDFVKDADAFFRRHRQEFLDAGYEQTYGTLKDGVMQFTHEHDGTVTMVLDRRGDRL